MRQSRRGSGLSNYLLTICCHVLVSEDVDSSMTYPFFIVLGMNAMKQMKLLEEKTRKYEHTRRVERRDSVLSWNAATRDEKGIRSPSGRRNSDVCFRQDRTSLKLPVSKQEKNRLSGLTLYSFRPLNSWGFFFLFVFQ